MAPSDSPPELVKLATGRPVIFSASGLLKPDVRLQVFNQSFHVHSVILNLYSSYFRNYLNSTNISGDATFKFEYAANLDANGKWALEKTYTSTVALIKNPDTITTELMKSRDDAVAFEKLLKALYCKKYVLDSFREFSEITRLAEAFGCLPALSTSIYRTLWLSSSFVEEIPSNSKQVLILAQKLRHPLLFREALVHVVSRWRGYSRFLDEHSDLTCVIVLAYNRVCARLLNANQEMILAMTREISGDIKKLICPLTRNLDPTELPTQNAFFYRWLCTEFEKAELRQLEGVPEIITALKLLLENNLVLGRSGAQAGADDFKHGFLCASIHDWELPWDTKIEDSW